MLTQGTTLYDQTTSTKSNWLDQLARRIVLKQLSRLQIGTLTVTDVLGRHTYGSSNDVHHHAEVYVANLRFYTRLALGGSVGAGEAYADGDWESPDLAAVIRLMVANERVLDAMDGAASRWLRQGAERVEHWRNANTLNGSRRNIAAHYDLSNDFFRTWLDSRMMYSCAIFEDQDDLEQASERKLQRLCELLALNRTDHLLEIGSGWGGLATYAASHYGCRVTTTTISKAQFDEAQARVKDAGLEQQISVVLQDYRELQGRYDKVVSVEMVEAVGDQFVDGYFNKIDELLEPGGKFVIQAITIADQRYDRALREVDFIKKHIFPGSFIPSVSRLVRAAANTPDLRLIELHDIGPHYATTLRAWSENFASAREQLFTLGFDERFQRLWQFYFAYCEGGFSTRAIGDIQAVFEKPTPLTRREH